MSSLVETHDNKNNKSTLSFVVMATGLACAIMTVVSALSTRTECINSYFLRTTKLTGEFDKTELLRDLGFKLSCFLLMLTLSIMGLRIFTFKPNPAKGRDGLLIGTLNQIMSNTIQQTVIFGGLYFSILFSQSQNHVAKIGEDKVLAFASLFILGRILFSVGYLLIVVTGIQTWRSFGFGINLLLYAIMIGHHCSDNFIGKFLQATGFLAI